MLHRHRYRREGLIVELEWMRGAGCGAGVGERVWLEVAVGKRERSAMAWEASMPELGVKVLVTTENG
ncbi:unnamed protein product [Dovyalis caffra]|uniref:Uncharacterized protein n=1 Tax=Dovyalis caffra TaxID=77055 RepID=A0AAV1QWC4_9ROSI|nr:unnamed protein product [Dovyalis caffra]